MPYVVSALSQKCGEVIQTLHSVDVIEVHDRHRWNRTPNPISGYAYAYMHVLQTALTLLLRLFHEVLQRGAVLSRMSIFQNVVDVRV